jgi:hypothetical protein
MRVIARIRYCRAHAGDRGGLWISSHGRTRQADRVDRPDASAPISAAPVQVHASRRPAWRVRRAETASLGAADSTALVAVRPDRRFASTSWRCSTNPPSGESK